MTKSFLLVLSLSVLVAAGVVLQMTRTRIFVFWNLLLPTGEFLETYLSLQVLPPKNLMHQTFPRGSKAVLQISLEALGQLNPLTATVTASHLIQFATV